MEKLRLGIIGMGNMGCGHLRSILNGECPNWEVTAVADTDPAKLERARGCVRQLRAFTQPKA